MLSARSLSVRMFLFPLLMTVGCMLLPAEVAAQPERSSTSSKVDRRPALGFQKFLKTARKARSMDDILPFLPEEQQQKIRERQQAWSPEVARERQELFAQSEAFRGKDVSLLTRSPYESELSRYRAIAKKVTGYVSTEKEGDRATLNVKVRFADGSSGDAKIVMVREGSNWKFAKMASSPAGEL